MGFRVDSRNDLPTWESWGFTLRPAPPEPEAIGPLDVSLDVLKKKTDSELENDVSHRVRKLLRTYLRESTKLHPTLTQGGNFPPGWGL